MTGIPTAETEVLTVGPFQQHTSLIWDPETLQGLVIDPGGETDRILEIIARAGITVDAILLTHGHLDHAGGADELRERLTKLQNGTYVPVIGPDRRDEFLLDSIEDAAAHYNVSGLRNVKPDQFLTHGDVISRAGIVLNVLYVPGHTPGHIVFHWPARKIVFAGDTLFRGTTGRTDLTHNGRAYGDSALLVRSIREQLMPMDDETIVIPGHGLATTIGAERAENPFLV